MSMTDERRRGAESAQLLANPLLKEAMQMIERRIVDQLAQADITPERITKLQSLLAAHRMFHRYLSNVVSTGTMAAMDDVAQRKKVR